MLLDTLFRVKGYTTRVVYTGHEAVQSVEVGEPDAVVLDVMMPEMDGWETYRQLREFSNIPVLFLTALTSLEDADRALQIGVNDYIRKPFPMDRLIDSVQRLIG
jgi:DNA-binding response OmpR family regulator